MFTLRRSNVAVVVAAIIAFIACLAFVSSAAFPSVARVLLVNAPYLLFWLAGCYGWGSVMLRIFKIGAERETAFEIVTAITLGIGVVAIFQQLLGLFGVVSQLAAFAILGVGVALFIGRFVIGRDQLAARWTRIQTKLKSDANWNWALVLLIPGAAIATAAACVPPGLLWSANDPHGYDVLAYHLQVPREWYEAARIMPLEHNVFSFMPMLVETHFLIAMELRAGPFTGMYLAQLMSLTMAALAVVAVYFAMRPRSLHQAVVAALTLGLMPWILMLASIAYSEAGMLLFATVAMGWLIRSIDSNAPIRCLAIGGALLGFACGAKLTAVILVLVAPLVVCFWRGTVTRRAAGLCALTVASALTLSPWLIRNAIWTGNPVFPQATSLFGRAHWTADQEVRWQTAHAPRADQKPLSARLDALWNQVLADWRFGFTVIPLAVFGVVMARRREPWFLLIGLFGVTLFWMFGTHLQSRFFVIAIPLVALMCAQPASGHFATIALAVMVIGLGSGLVRVQARLAQAVHVAGTETLSDVLPEQVTELVRRSDVSIALVGDGRAFWYELPLSRLRYRSVFDALDANDVVSAWLRDGPRDGEMVLIDPKELARFHASYWCIPAMPQAWQTRTTPFFLTEP